MERGLNAAVSRDRNIDRHIHDITDRHIHDIDASLWRIHGVRGVLRERHMVAAQVRAMM
jgi:hypothetical protein